MALDETEGHNPIVQRVNLVVPELGAHKRVLIRSKRKVVELDCFGVHRLLLVVIVVGDFLVQQVEDERVALQELLQRNLITARGIDDDLGVVQDGRVVVLLHHQGRRVRTQHLAIVLFIENLEVGFVEVAVL